MIVSLQDYRRLTNDLASVDADVTQALTDAQDVFERETGRFFEQAQRTETMRLYMSGRVYPKAFPIAAVSGQPGAYVDGAAIMVGYGFQYAQGINPFISGFGADTSYYQPQITMTYTGGYTPDQMPTDIKRAIAEMAFNALHPAPLEGVPVGANSVAIAGLITLNSAKGLSPFETRSPAVRRIIRRYKRPQAVSF